MYLWNNKKYLRMRMLYGSIIRLNCLYPYLCSYAAEINEDDLVNNFTS